MSAPLSSEQGSIALIVAYDGALFSGFARQPGRPTVQGRLEDALAVALRRQAPTVGAGRTDAGVHALAQVVSFASDGDEPPLPALARSLTALAGPGIVVTGARAARPGFSARFDALSREYRYRVATGGSPPLFLSRFAWWVGHALDAGAMSSAASVLLGEHDFRSFCASASAESGSTTRRLLRIEVVSEEHLGEECLSIHVEGNAFLHSMVRVIVGSLVEVGKGNRPAEWLGEALGARDRAAAGPTAPPHGLTLWSVTYPDACWR